MQTATPAAPARPVLPEGWADRVPVRSVYTELYPFDRGTFLVQQTQHGHQIRVSELTHHLLGLVDGQRTVDDLAAELRRRYGTEIPAAEVYRLLFGKLAAYGIVESSHPVAPRRGDAYLRLRVGLLRESWVQHLSRYATGLFAPRLFFALYGGMLLFLTTLFFYRQNLTAFYQSITLQNTVLFYGVFLFSALLHELGHATACSRFGARPGAIGFGFYLFTPVLYADVSDAWKLPPAQRVIVDLSGIFMELLFCTGLGLAFLFTQNYLLLNVAVVVMLATYTNLNPLLRFDGYWAVSDLLRVPNLRATSNRKLGQVMAWLRGRQPQPLRSGLDGVLALYAALSWLFIGAFLIGILVYNPRSILYFPYNLYDLFRTLLFDFSSVHFEWVKQQVAGLLVPVLFFITLANLLRQRLRTAAGTWRWPAGRSRTP